SGKRSRLSPAYMLTASPHCLRLLAHWIFIALAFALDSAGSNIAAKIAMMAITTSNSINVNARDLRGGSALADSPWISSRVELKTCLFMLACKLNHCLFYLDRAPHPNTRSGAVN